MKNILHIPQKKESLVTAGELNLAKEIQRHLLPKVFPFPNKIEVGTLYQPAKQVGGDFYDAIQVDDRKAAFLIGDVSGHSVPAALFMTQCITLLKALIKMDFSLLKIASVHQKHPPAKYAFSLSVVFDTDSGIEGVKNIVLIRVQTSIAKILKEKRRTAWIRLSHQVRIASASVSGNSPPMSARRQISRNFSAITGR